MKKLLGIVVLGLIFYIMPANVNAGWFDPSWSGCVYQKGEAYDSGAKIKCVSFKFNESKNPGSMKKAEDACYRELHYYGRKYGEAGYDIVGCTY